MKLQKDYKEVSEKFKHFYESYKAETLEHVKEVKNSKEYNNLEVRIAFDIARACGEYRRLTTKYSNNDDVNDNHLKTLFVQCFRELHIKL